MQLFSDHVLLPEGLASAAVEVSEGRITAVTPCTEAPQGAVDLGGCLLMPAWVNGHTHLPMSSLRALGGHAARSGNVVEELWFGIEQRLTADDIRAFTRMGALECLLCGTGAVFEHYYAGRAVAEGLRDVGLAGLVAPTLQDVSGPGVSQLDAQIEATLAIRDDPSLAAAGIGAMWGPHATDTVSAGLWRRVLDLDDQLPVHVHVAQSPEEADRAQAEGRTPVERLDEAGVLDRDVLLVHGLYVTDADRGRLDPARHRLGHCPWSQLQFAFPAPLDPWLDDGFDVVIGTDAGACNDSMNVQQELRLAAVGSVAEVSRFAEAFRAEGEPRRRGLSERRTHAYQATARRSDPQWLLGTVGRAAGGLCPSMGLGRIAVGSMAHLAAYDLSHPALWPAPDPLRALTFGDATQALHSLMVSGRWVGEVGDVRALLRRDDVRAWRTEATERWKALTRSL
jgi:cytosine/adenosine deaminase-related metal-dependent hydrolase